MQVQLYACYHADKRLSMDIYTHEVCQGLLAQGIDASVYRPSHKFESRADSMLAMRYLRYWVYAKELNRAGLSADVHHVTDHGYAHLHPTLLKSQKKSGRKNSLNVVTAHDLIPYLTWKGRISGSRHVHKPSLNLYSLKYLQRFDRIIAPSHNTANDIHEVLNISLDRISVVPPIIAEHFKAQPPEQVARFRQQLNASADTRLIMVSGREHYKNLATSFSVVKGLLEQGLKLRIIRAGLSDKAFQQLVDEFGLQQYVESIYLPHHRDLVLLYSAVDCLLFPSWYEGFGMPVVEALACGTCVVTSNAASLPEAGGHLALRAAPNDVDGLSQHALTCLHNNEHQQRIKEQGAAWASQFGAVPLTNRLIQAYNV